MKHSHDFQQLYSFPVCGWCVIQLRARGEQFSTVNTVKHAVNYYSQHAAACLLAAAASASAAACLLLPLLLFLKLARDYVARFSTSRMSGISIPDSLLEENGYYH